MIKIKYCLTVLMLFVSLQNVCLAIGEKNDNPLNTEAGKFEAKCYDENLYPSSAEQGNCISEATVLWDKELNKYYKLLMGLLKQPQRADLQNAELQWIKFRDTEIKSDNGIRDAFRLGSGFGVLELDLVRDRAMKLKSWYDFLKDMDE